MVSAANEQQRQPLSEEPVSQKPNGEILLKPVNAINFLKQDDPSVAGSIKPHLHSLHHQHHLLGGGSLEEEQRNGIAFKYVGAPTNSPGLQTKLRRTGLVALTPEGLSEEDALEAAKTSSAESKSATVNGHTAFKVKGSEHSSESAVHTAEHRSGIDAKNDLLNAPVQSIEKLLTLVGPDAITNLKERLHEVWVDIDSVAATDLDVMARMPVTTEGLSASELLMVKSPQGIHFVAFLRNRNDFEVLQTFDHHSLLPGNSIKQLMEAAMMAYEQLGAVFKDGSDRLEQRVRSRATDRDQSLAFVTQELRGRWIQAKRRRKKCGDLVEELVERIDEIDSKEPDRKPGNSAETERVIKPENERPVLNWESED